MPTNYATVRGQEYQSMVKMSSFGFDSRGETFTILVICLAIFGYLLVNGFLLLQYGGVSFISFFLAIIPAALVLLSLYAFNRWDVKPFILLVLCFMWGAGIATVSSLIFNSTIPSFFSEDQQDFIGTTFVAPIVEELGKATLLVLILLFLRKFLNSPLDGLVYAGFIAAGFAFTENILYFSQAYSDSGTEGLLVTFFLRGIISPFAHVTFTILIGFGIGLGVMYNGVKGGLLGAAVGTVGALLLHSFWNGSTYIPVSEDYTFLLFVLLYIFVQVPIFVFLIFLSIKFFNNQKAKTFKHLIEYSQAGWFTESEVYFLGTTKGRRSLIVWSKKYNGIILIKNYIKQVTYLTVIRDRIIKGDLSSKTQLEEQSTLNTIVTVRHYIMNKLTS